MYSQADLKNFYHSSETPKRPTILVIDDERDIQNLLAEIMRLNGYKVYIASDGQQGLKIFKLEHQHIDLVFLDMRMPVMGGKETFREIRKIEPGQNVLIITGYADHDDINDLISKGACGVIKKPFRMFDVISKTKALIE